jgi:hypothetical protein
MIVYSFFDGKGKLLKSYRRRATIYTVVPYTFLPFLYLSDIMAYQQMKCNFRRHHKISIRRS